ncbi:MAG: putative Vitamin import system, periplasmic binding protein BtuF [Cyanobacteria bacterium RYN_339]|nr:putative Vitamin import system, periplasmic binding protein BtuF [Cyanobacteria bacterium RYN_339]
MKLPAFKRCVQHPIVVLVLALLALLLSNNAHAASPARRIVSLGPALTEMLFALGLDQQVVGVTTYCNFPAAALAKPKIGDALHLNEERVISLRPDLIVSVEGDRTRLDRIAKLTGARLQVLPTRHVNDIWGNFRTLGALTGRAAEAAAQTAKLQARVAALTAKPGGTSPGVFYMVWDQPLMTAGQDSYLNDLITLAGGRNVVMDRSSYPSFSWEALLAANPDVILGPRNMDKGLKALEGRYPALKAVQGHKLRTLPDDVISRPGPRVAEALAAVRAALR